MRITFILFICSYTLNTVSQNTSFIHLDTTEKEFVSSLTYQELNTFKDELRYKFNLFYESILTILDENLDLELRYNARFVLNELFSSSSSSVSDYLDNPRPETHSISEYANLLFQLRRKKPILYKSYKFSDSVYIKPTVRAHSALFNKLFQVYEGNSLYMEKYVNSKDLGEGEFDVTKRNDLKNITFKISHDENDNYILIFKSLDFIDKNDITFNYKKDKEEVLASSNSWTNVAKEEYVAYITKEAKDKGVFIEIDTEKVTANTERAIIVERPLENQASLVFRKLSIYDYVVPGLGHRNFGKEPLKTVRSILYSGLFISTVAMAVRFDGISRRENDISKLINDPIEKKNWEDISLKNNAGTNWSIGAAFSVFAANILHIKILYSTKKRIAEHPKF